MRGTTQRKRKTKDGALGLTREEWVEGARKALIKHGVAALKVDRIAKDLGVTRGGFYWRFEGVKDLLDALLDDWRRTNTAPIMEALDSAASPGERYRAMQMAFIEEKKFNPAYDAAIREWARVSPRVAKVVEAVDDERIEGLHRVFIDAGYDEPEALVRARVTYFHQVGYYAMGVRESQKRRVELSPYFYRVLTGSDLGEPLQAPEKSRRK